NFIRERICPNAQVVRCQLMFIAKLIARFCERPMRASESDDADLSVRRDLDNRRRHKRTRMLELGPQPLHVAFIVFWAFAVLRLSVVTATAREIRRGGMV